MKTLRHLLGYLLGFSVFVMLIPWLLVAASRNPWPVLDINLIPFLWLRLVIGLPVLGIGLLFAAWSNIDLLVKGKGGPVDVFNVALSPRSEKLVVTGPYRFCRNPMVFGMLSILVNSLYDLVILLIAVPFIVIYLKLTEEKRLKRDFGDEFRKYRSEVPMIVPFTRTKKKRKFVVSL
jgi:protein-S-isoprenylcysteine O-methyltransferase Ste14